jgi:hypothetical protein
VEVKDLLRWADGETLHSASWYSVGGGFIVTPEAFGGQSGI